MPRRSDAQPRHIPAPRTAEKATAPRPAFENPTNVSRCRPLQITNIHVRASRFCLLIGVLSLVSGCGAGASEGTGEGAIHTSDAILLRDENNYRLTASLSLPSIETAAATDLEICWTSVSDDIQCHALSAQSGLDNVALLRIAHLSEAQVEEALTTGELTQSSIDGYVQFNTDHRSTCTKLSQFSFFGTAIDVTAQYVESSDHSYMLLFTKGTSPGVGARVMMFLKPVSSSANTRVDAPSGCGMLDVRADLSSMEKVPAGARESWTVDWRSVTRNGQGGTVVFPSIDKLLIGFYQGATVAELEKGILDLETLATGLWELPLEGGRTADLSQAKERSSGTAFTGFSRVDGVWLLSLLCTTCQNPAPQVLAILDPSTAGAR
jgi:hypothetical protein